RLRCTFSSGWKRRCCGVFPSKTRVVKDTRHMLRRLEIEDYGLIARADVEFAGGATIFTGETGSGKTMLLGALGFGLGARSGGGERAAAVRWWAAARGRPP